MVRYSMTLLLKNKSNFTLKPIEPVSYAFDYGNGEMEQAPEVVEARSTGVVGKLQKKSFGEGLWGVIAYNSPDPNMITVMQVQMPAKAMTINKVLVGVVPRSTTINADLCRSIEKDPVGMGFGYDLNWRYEQDGKLYILYMHTAVKDPKAYNTAADIDYQIDRIYKSVDEDPLGVDDLMESS